MRWKSVENPPFLIDTSHVKSEAKIRAWQQLKNELTIGEVITGRVFTQAILGVFFDAGVGFPVRMNITDFGKETVHGMQFPEDYPALNSIITGKRAGFDDGNYQVVVRKLEEDASYYQSASV
jgi:hypothetical protein